jgi:hypothetical protein
MVVNHLVMLHIFFDRTRQQKIAMRSSQAKGDQIIMKTIESYPISCLWGCASAFRSTYHESLSNFIQWTEVSKVNLVVLNGALPLEAPLVQNG